MPTDNIVEKIIDGLDADEPEQKSLITAIDSVRKTNPDNQFKCINMYGRYLHNTGQQTKAIEFFSSVAHHYQSLESPTKQDFENLIECYIPLGAAFEELGLKNMAMDYYMKGIDIAEDHDLQRHRAMLLNNIGVIYFGINDYDRALEYFTEASTINLKYQRNHELFINYNNLAEIYLVKNDLTKSMDYSLRALQYLDENDDGAMYYMMHTNIGNIYSLKKEYPMALSYLKNAITHQDKEGLTSYLITSYLAISEVYSKMNLADSAHYFADKALHLAQQNQNISLQSQTLLAQSSLAKVDKNYAESLQLLEKADMLKDSIQRLDNRKKMEDWEKIYKLDRQEAKDNSVISTWNPETVFYLMFGIVAILAGVIIILYMVNKNKDKSLKNKDLEILRQGQKETERIAAEMEKNREMQDEIDQRNRQLTTYTLEKLRLSECVTEINIELKKLLLEINPRNKEHKEHIQNILKKLLGLEIRNDWEEFQYYFEQVHPRFYEKLESNYPNLTAKEKHLCAFISLGLTTKEIASITFREVRSCEASRNRLRKKLGVDSETDLTNFIRQITMP